MISLSWWPGRLLGRSVKELYILMSTSSSSLGQLCALAAPADAEEMRRSLDRAGLLDVNARGFKHENAIALPLKAAASTSAADHLCWSGGELRAMMLQPPQRRGANPLRNALEKALSGIADNALLSEEALPKRWEKLGDVVLFAPRGLFDESSPAAAAFRQLEPDRRRAVLSALAKSLGARRLGVQGLIEDTLHRNSTARLVWPEDCADGWTVQRENGIAYGLDVTRSMFSSGNGTEKARVSNFCCTGQTVVDLYAGIGYFTLPYLVHAKASHLHACEWDEDALAALNRNLVANGVAERCTVHPGDNSTAAARIAAASGTPDGRVAHHVNLGLIPSSEAAWSVALSVLRPEGGMLHVHANVGSLPDDGTLDEVASLSLPLSLP